MKMLTFLPIEEIEEMEKWEGSRINEAKEILAYELTALVHGKEEADKARDAARAVFSGAMVSENMPTTTLRADQFADGKISVIDMLVVSKLAPSKGEARRLIQQGGVALGESKIEAFDATVSLEAFEGDVVIRKGKKVFHRFVLA